MRIEPPKTVEDFKKILHSIVEMQGNPYCDHLMFMSLEDKKKKVEAKIEHLKAESK